jgi:hypothetical protein
VAKNDAYVQVETVDPLILKGLPDVSFSYDTKTDWRHAEIMHWFSEYGIEKFESLDIWEIKEFDDKFIATTGRSPKPKTFPKWLIALNTIKNKLKAK